MTQPLKILLEETTRRAIVKALITTMGNKSQAAILLGMSRGKLMQRLKQYEEEGNLSLPNDKHSVVEEINDMDRGTIY